MKDFNGNKINYKGKEYTLVFNLNVMGAIQDEYGTIDKWGKLSDGSEGEVDVKAVIFGLREMINEGIDIENEENGTDIKPFTLKQVGRIISEVGLQDATSAVNDTVLGSVDSGEKNA